jgi:hypothetical protein
MLLPLSLNFCEIICSENLTLSFHAIFCFLKIVLLQMFVLALSRIVVFNLPLKVPSHQIRLGLKCNGWIGLGEYKDRRW